MRIAVGKTSSEVARSGLVAVGREPRFEGRLPTLLHSGLRIIRDAQSRLELHAQPELAVDSGVPNLAGKAADRVPSRPADCHAEAAHGSPVPHPASPAEAIVIVLRL